MSTKNLAWYHLKSLKQIAQKGKWPQGLTPCDRKALRNSGLVQNHYISQKGWAPEITPIGFDIIKALSKPFQLTLNNWIKK